MTKVHTTISIDSATLEHARMKGFNISREAERAIRQASKFEKKDVDENLLLMKCTQCGDAVEEGFYCKEGQMFFCLECHEKWDIARKCKAWHDKTGQHLHIRVPGYDYSNEKYIKEVKKIEN